MAGRDVKRTGVREHDAIALLRGALEGSAYHPLVEQGIGDDAAVLNLRGSGRLVVSVDSSVENVHFNRAWLSLEEVAARALHAAVSDIAAMAAEPVACVSALTLPRGFSRAEIHAIARGQATAAEELGSPVVGGNITRGAELALTTTVLGRAKKPLLRSGARPGDDVWLLGKVGLASMGLRLLQRTTRARRPAERAAFAACIAAWKNPKAQLAAGRALHGVATSCVDVSDGVAADLNHVAEASEVRIELSKEALASTFSPALLLACEHVAVDPMDCALYGGEDYALLASGPHHKRPREAVKIGSVHPGTGVFLCEGGRARRVRGGYSHDA